MRTYFENLNIDGWSGQTVLVDIDGTLTVDGSAEVSQQAVAQMKRILSANTVFLTSNKRKPERNYQVAQMLNVPFIDSPFKKPNKKVIERFSHLFKQNVLVIGDKFLTDGLFAKNIGARFIKIRRLTSKSDSVKTKITYFVDDVVSALLSPFFRSF